jgi:hypothetical protein
MDFLSFPQIIGSAIQDYFSLFFLTNRLDFALEGRTQNGIRTAARVTEVREWGLIGFDQKAH